MKYGETVTALRIFFGQETCLHVYSNAVAQSSGTFTTR